MITKAFVTKGSASASINLACFVTGTAVKVLAIIDSRHTADSTVMHAIVASCSVAGHQFLED